MGCIILLLCEFYSHYYKEKIERKLNFKSLLCFRAYKLSLLMNFYQYYMERKYRNFMSLLLFSFSTSNEFQITVLEPFYFGFLFPLRIICSYNKSLKCCFMKSYYMKSFHKMYIVKLCI